ncbi:protein phosphatase [Clostridium cavendishii DSM 21758]|uniref:Protein phosphatase n=1 Tax=Clostridium cavendishii DSM 21758 TaxID=1121302 RepID=A0A1M6K9J1_9CLOT|nr:Stp1/IreP family PP2C-type Ser/Thr phosphatase [Clostridium cavendishii]SHJ55570.1 protein phosphatase [Clostridium cavendishii DSM 21758]
MIGHITDIGNYRSINEDYVNSYICDEFSIFVVADGMGGHNAGEIASKMAVEGIIDFVKLNYNNYDKEKLLTDAIVDINYKIFKYSLDNEALQGMGTTIIAAIKFNNKIQIANVGDSSCFAISKDTIVKVTKDHSLVQELLDCGSITEEQARVHPRKNIITRAVGTNVKIDVDIYNIENNQYEYFILCTDGLTNDVTKTEILNFIKNSSNLQVVCENLVTQAKSVGGKDNITVLIFKGEF